VPDAVIVIPVFDDWESLRLLIDGLDEALEEKGFGARLVVIDDASPTEPEDRFDDLSLAAFRDITMLELRRNLGHQRAIAVGLAWAREHIDPALVVVMDGDGEDDPRDVPRLIAACRDTQYREVVFAERTKRSESTSFRFFYGIYRMVHRIFVGHDVQVGNFSALPRCALERLVAVSDVWNHYAASVFKARLPKRLIPTVRATRLRGRAKMNFVSLVTHGLSALSVFGDAVGTRLLLLASVFVVALGIGLVGLVGIRLGTDLAIPGWTSSMVGLVFILIVQIVTASLVFALSTIGLRSQSGFLPLRDYAYFVLGSQTMPFASRASRGPKDVGTDAGSDISDSSTDPAPAGRS
jgi:polyisoprenyl-phosphate glycosyltransferase